MNMEQTIIMEDLLWKGNVWEISGSWERCLINNGNINEGMTIKMEHFPIWSLNIMEQTIAIGKLINSRYFNKY